MPCTFAARSSCLYTLRYEEYCSFCRALCLGARHVPSSSVVPKRGSESYRCPRREHELGSRKSSWVSSGQDAARIFKYRCVASPLVVHDGNGPLLPAGALAPQGISAPAIANHAQWPPTGRRHGHNGASPSFSSTRRPVSAHRRCDIRWRGIARTTRQYGAMSYIMPTSSLNVFRTG